jgi:hypothetical protein
VGFPASLDDRAPVAAGAPVNIDECTIVPFPSAASGNRASRKALLTALRISESAIIVDFSGCRTLNRDDIDFLLECAAQVVGRDTQMLLAAGSRVIRVLLEITLISTLMPVFDSLEQALAYPDASSETCIGKTQAGPTQQLWTT